MKRYLETFSRHRILLIAPLIISVVMAGWYVTTRPKVYASSTTMWFDTQVPSASSIDTPLTNGGTPSGQAQSVLIELLNTRDFRIKVGHRGPLASYYARPGTSARAVDDQVDGALQHAVTSTVVGPQVLGIALKGPAPLVAANTLQAVVDQFTDELNAARNSRGSEALTYYQSSLVVASHDLTAAENAVTNYQVTHPPVPAGATPDPVLSRLSQTALAAQARYTDVQNNLSTLNLQQKVNGAATSHVIDRPTASLAPVSSKKKMVFAGVAALLLGGLISLGVLALLTAADTRARSAEDLEDLGLPVVGEIGQLPRTRRHFRGSRVA
jgi:hypothetical protein